MLNHVGTLRIETNRLILRKHEITDADDMFNNWVTDPEVSKFWGWEPHKSIEETKMLLMNWIEDSVKLETYHWIIELKSISQAIGYIYLTDINDMENSVSVHFALSKKYWKQGIMTEACNSVVNFAFSVLKAKRIHTHHHIDNHASGRVMHKCGMYYLKTAHKDVPGCEQVSGDYCYYEIQVVDWERTV